MNDGEVILYDNERLVEGKGFYNEVFCELVENDNRKGYKGR
jgi:hypothetical protein